MKMREKYGITFEKSGANRPFTRTEDIYNADIGIHISNGGKQITRLQIIALQKALNGERIQEDWGEVMGSTLDIFPLEGTVQVNDCNRRIPIVDFKALLEEWLDFISD